MTSLRRQLLLLSLLFPVIAFASVGSMTFDIPAQPLPEALRVYAHQTKMQVLYNGVLLERGTSSAVTGTYDKKVALEKMLKDTGFEVVFSKGNAATIRPIQNAAGEVTTAQVVDASGTLQVAQAETATPSQVEDRGEDKKAFAGASGSSESEKGDISEIVVTAQKRKERLQDVPISISVLSGEDLDRSSAEGITEALSRVPGVATTMTVQGGGTQVTIRGVTAGSPVFQGSSTSAYYLDSVPFGLIKSAIAPDSNAYDLDRIEVLRGPQGTLYGASALNGVVRVLTQDANLNEFQLKARTSFSTTNGGSGNYRGDMAINAPLVEGKLAARVVVGYENWSGWIDRPNDNDANDAAMRTMRLKIDSQPTDGLSIGVSAWLSRADYGAPSTSGDGRSNASVVDEPMLTDYDTYGLKIGYELSGFSISSMTSYLSYENAGDLDLAPYGLTPLFTRFDSKIFSQEIVLNSTRNGAWKWSAGGFYRDGKDRLLQTASFLAAPADYSDGSESFAVFGELGRRFLDDKLELALGLRSFHDDVINKENIQSQGLPGVPLYRATDSFDSTTPRAILTWHPDSDLMFYGSYSRGFRSGFPQNANTIQQAPGFPSLRPDKLSNYEIGAKGALADRRLSFDTALYYIDWRDVQQTLRMNINGVPTSAPVNGSSASGLGFDFAVTARPLDALELGISLNWNDLGWDSMAFSPSGGLLFEKGDRLNYSPEYTVGPWVNYIFPFGRAGLEGRFSASANYTSKQILSDVSGGNRSLQSGDGMLIARTSFAVSSGNHWTATLYGDNINNERGTTISVAYGVPDWSPRLRPRTVGLQLDYRFGQ